ncbi:MAG: thermonuclease family protein [bacterium]
MENQLYSYRARVVSVYDGDTVRANIDLGLNTWVMNEKLRLARIDAPELRGDQREAGLAARDFLRELVLDKEIILETIKDRKGKFGRYLAELWLKNEAGIFVNVNDLMVQKGYAVVYA